MAETVTVAYDGPIAELEVTDPREGGRSVGTVKNGATLEVPKHIADDLVQREDFSLVGKTQTQKDGK